MVIDAEFYEGQRKTYTQSVSQYDKGLSIRFVGIGLPEDFEAHFSNYEDGGVATVVTGKKCIVRIPDAYLATGEYVYVWVYGYGKTAGGTYHVENEIVVYSNSGDEHTDLRKARTFCMAVIPVVRRSMPVIDPDTEPEDPDDPYEYDVQDESLIIIEK